MINLNDLSYGMSAITPAFGQYLAEAGAVCLESQGHVSGKVLSVRGTYQRNFVILWPSVTDQMLNCLNDPDVATELGAVGIAVLLTQELVGYSVVQRSRKGTGFDYWLGDDSEIPFQNLARLEISGIRKGDDATIRARTRQKLRQTDPSDNTRLPAHVVIVEFGHPVAQMEMK